MTYFCSWAADLSKWERYSFNGRVFQHGGTYNSPSIWLRNGFTPSVEEPRDPSVNISKLPPVSGAVAGICYLQSSGGKFADHSKAKPLSAEQITIRNLEFGTSIIRSNNRGFFVKALRPGSYQLFCRGAGVEVMVKEGQTTLIPIKGAKRMTD